MEGSYHKEHYQQALLKCDGIKRKLDVVPLQAKFQPNAITFEVFNLITGYCDLKKMPKLVKAIKAKEIDSGLVYHYCICYSTSKF